jgi:peptide subunit release factor 1 (eRF1)
VECWEGAGIQRPGAIHTMSSNFDEVIRTIESTPLYGSYQTTVYVPPGENKEDIILKMSDEMRKFGARKYPYKSEKLNIITEISAIIFRFRFSMSIPQNGMIVFCGLEKTTDYGLTRPINTMIEPPNPVKEFKVVVGKKFETETAKELI